MKTLIIGMGLLVSTTAWSGVAVHDSTAVESTAAKEQMNYIKEGNFSSGTIGGSPPSPWRCSGNTEATRVTVETPAGRAETERWVRLVDDSDKENANIRQSFAPVSSGRFQARLISNKDGGRLSFNLGGSGTASKPEERAVQLSVDSDGLLVVRGEQKLKTSMQIKTGEVYLVRCDLEAIKDGKTLRVVAELVEENSQRQSRVETEVEKAVITAVRVTSTKAETGVDYYVTDLSLIGR